MMTATWSPSSRRTIGSSVSPLVGVAIVSPAPYSMVVCIASQAWSSHPGITLAVAHRISGMITYARLTVAIPITTHRISGMITSSITTWKSRLVCSSSIAACAVSTSSTWKVTEGCRLLKTWSSVWIACCWNG